MARPVLSDTALMLTETSISAEGWEAQQGVTF